MRKLGYSLILVGAVIGPGYLIWAQNFSGREIASHTIFTQDAAAVRLGRVAVSGSSGGQWEEPFELMLEPEMGTIAVVGEAAAFANPRRQRTFSVVVSAVSERGELWTDTVGFTNTQSSDRDATVTRTNLSERVGAFRVSERRPVRFLFEQGPHSALPVTSVSLNVQVGTHTPLRAVYGTGFGLLLLGFGALFLTDRAASRGMTA